jgi:hypothetical protein
MKLMESILQLWAWSIAELHRNPAATAATAALLSSAVAFAAVIGGIMTSLFAFIGTQVQIGASLEIADRQIRSAVLATNRQNWINDLRNEISKAVQMLRGMSDLLLKQPVDHTALDLLKRDYVFSRAKINLLTNPQETDHLDLCEALRDAFDLVYAQKNVTFGPLNAKIDQIVVTSQKILKREWERVKALQ